jgi:hypothetical protein
MNKLIIESAKLAGKTALTAGAYCAGAIVGTVGGFWVGNKVIEGTANAVHFVKNKMASKKKDAPKAVVSSKAKAKVVASAPKKAAKPKAKSKKKITEKVVEALQEA